MLAVVSAVNFYSKFLLACAPNLWFFLGAGEPVRLYFYVCTVIPAATNDDDDESSLFNDTLWDKR